ncbi:MAG: TerB family tellurite resistance protein [Alphaproteobacteria bacterium]|nr:TerB family tellurite resistance protein [Alphaproteobacteria bacterium]
MLDALKSFISEPRKISETSPQEPTVQSAAAALLVEAAMADGTFDDQERAQVKDVLVHLFSLPEDSLDGIIADAEETVAKSNQLYGFARTVKDNLDYDGRVELMQMLWEVVYADGQLDDFEANLVRRVSGLLYVTDQDSGRARKAALEQLGLDLENLT